MLEFTQRHSSYHLIFFVSSRAKRGFAWNFFLLNEIENIACIITLTKLALSVIVLGFIFILSLVNCDFFYVKKGQCFPDVKQCFSSNFQMLLAIKRNWLFFGSDFFHFSLDVIVFFDSKKRAMSVFFSFPFSTRRLLTF